MKVTEDRYGTSDGRRGLGRVRDHEYEQAIS